MTKEREALKLALSDIENYQIKRQEFDRFENTVIKIKEALAQPEQPEQETVAVDPLREYLENIAVSDGWDESDGEGVYEYLQRMTYQAGHNAGVAHHKQALTIALMKSEQEQEPVGVIQHLDELNEQWTKHLPIGTKLYTSPNVAEPRPKRKEWVGLTDDVIFKVIRPLCETQLLAQSLIEISMDEYRAIEAKLKELNHDNKN